MLRLDAVQSLAVGTRGRYIFFSTVSLPSICEREPPAPTRLPYPPRGVPKEACLPYAGSDEVTLGAHTTNALVTRWLRPGTWRGRQPRSAFISLPCCCFVCWLWIYEGCRSSFYGRCCLVRVDERALRFAYATAACSLEKSCLPLVPDSPRKDATENRAEPLAIDPCRPSALCRQADISFLCCRSDEALYSSLMLSWVRRAARVKITNPGSLLGDASTW